MEPTCALCGETIDKRRTFCTWQCRGTAREVLRSLRARRRHLESTSAASGFGAGLGDGVLAFRHGADCALELHALHERIAGLERALCPQGTATVLDGGFGPCRAGSAGARHTTRAPRPARVPA